MPKPWMYSIIADIFAQYGYDFFNIEAEKISREYKSASEFFGKIDYFTDVYRVAFPKIKVFSKDFVITIEDVRNV